MSSESAILSWVLALPALGGGVILALPESQARKRRTGARGVAFAFCLATVALAGIAAGWLDWASGDLQLKTRAGWLGRFGIEYFVGVDGISMPLVLLMAVVGLLVCWASYGIKRGGGTVKAYFALVMFWLAGALGTLIAMDLVMWFVFLVLSLVPLYFLIAGWGGDRKEKAARSFFWSSMIAAAAMLVVIVGIYRQVRVEHPAGEGAVFDVVSLSTGKPGPGDGRFGAPGFWIMLAGLGVLAGFVPAHRWLVRVLSEAPTPVAIIVVSGVQTIGGYGLMRMVYPLFASPALEHGWAAAVVGSITMIYAIVGALGQKDLRRAIAYASAAQMGWILLGLAMHTSASAAGVGYLLVGHAIATALVMFVVGMIHDRVGHAEIRRLGGLAAHAPVFGGWSAVAFLAAMGLPGLCVFAGELLILLGVFQAGGESGQGSGWLLMPSVSGRLAWLGAIGAVQMVLMAAFYLWTYQRVFLGAARPEHSNLARMSASEKWILALLGLAALGMGVVPMVVTEPMRAAVEAWMRGLGG